jgi:SNF2 family DNA or RNA helicase
MHVGIPESSGEPSIFGIDQMLRFDWKLSIGEVELSEEEFRALAASRRRLHHVRGQWIWLDDKLAGQLRVLAEKIRRRGGIPLKEVLRSYFGGPGEASDSLPETPQADWEIAAAPRLLRWMHELASQREIPPVRPPAAFRGSLRGYQAEGLAWLMRLRRHGFGACLADDMGLGKTIQYIAYLLKVREENPGAGPSLLICPTSLIGNWQKELARFSPDLRVHSHYGASRPKGGNRFAETVRGCDLVLTTYMTAFLDIDELCAARWNSLCLDEAQHIKNASAKQSAAIRKIPARHRIAMTGTPMENRLDELWSIFDFLNPGYLGGRAQFRRRYAAAAGKADGRSLEPVRRLIRPFLLRRMKADPLIAPDLPEKAETKVYVPLTKEQAALYESVLDDLLRGLGSRTGLARRGAILAALTRLKQICDHPALYIKEPRNRAPAAGESHKAARLLDMVRELRSEGDRCLIFTQFAEMGFMLKRLLERELAEPVLYLHGGTPKTERDRMVAMFQGGGEDAEAEIRPDGGAERARPGIFVLSLKAGGAGLNLTAANHVFHYDRWWNPAVEDQATDRAYRIGQKRHVQVHKFITLGTLEEKIDELIEKKSGLSRQITGPEEEWLTGLDTDELREILALRRDWLEE